MDQGGIDADPSLNYHLIQNAASKPPRPLLPHLMTSFLTSFPHLTPPPTLPLLVSFANLTLARCLPAGFRNKYKPERKLESVKAM